jgi:hypothetical protein
MSYTWFIVWDNSTNMTHLMSFPPCFVLEGFQTDLVGQVLVTKKLRVPASHVPLLHPNGEEEGVQQQTCSDIF